MSSESPNRTGTCPVMHGGMTTTESSVMDWWPKP